MSDPRWPQGPFSNQASSSSSGWGIPPGQPPPQQQQGWPVTPAPYGAPQPPGAFGQQMPGYQPMQVYGRPSGGNGAAIAIMVVVVLAISGGVTAWQVMSATREAERTQQRAMAQAEEARQMADRTMAEAQRTMAIQSQQMARTTDQAMATAHQELQAAQAQQVAAQQAATLATQDPLAEEPSASGAIPETLPRTAVVRVMSSARAQVQHCANGKTGVIVMAVKIKGADGTVAEAIPTASFLDATEKACVSSAVQRLMFPAFRRPMFSVVYPFAMH